jgi:hypothetical protein
VASERNPLRGNRTFRIFGRRVGMPLALVPVAVAVAVGALVFRSEVAPSQAGSSANKGAPLSAVVLQHGQDTGGSIRQLRRQRRFGPGLDELWLRLRRTDR